MPTNNLSTDQAEKRAAEERRAELQRRAEAQGIKPFDPDEWSPNVEISQTPEEIRREVDEFLALLCEWRDTPSTRSLD